jgi:nitrogen-specific signal transduction histidine kinase
MVLLKTLYQSIETISTAHKLKAIVPSSATDSTLRNSKKKLNLQENEELVQNNSIIMAELYQSTAPNYTVNQQGVVVKPESLFSE